MGGRLDILEKTNLFSFPEAGVNKGRMLMPEEKMDEEEGVGGLVELVRMEK